MPTTPTEDASIKSAQADNFDRLNEVVAGTAFDRHLRFLNFGYRPAPGEDPAGPRLGFAFPNKDSAQLLFQTIGDVPLAGARLVEVGCGRGGNLWLARRYLGPAEVVGVDIAAGSIRYCAEANPGPGACFVVGDAEELPLAAATADVVLSIESGATYPDIERFFAEVARLLRPGGTFCYADIVHHELVEPYVGLLASLGLEPLVQRDITANVTAARDERAARQQLAFAAADDADRATMAEFSGTTDSVLYHQFADGDHRYVLGRFRRTEAPPVGPLRLTDEQRTLARATATIAVDALTMSSAGTDRREVDRA